MCCPAGLCPSHHTARCIGERWRACGRLINAYSQPAGDMIACGLALTPTRLQHLNMPVPGMPTAPVTRTRSSRNGALAWAPRHYAARHFVVSQPRPRHGPIMAGLMAVPPEFHSMAVQWVCAPHTVLCGRMRCRDAAIIAPHSARAANHSSRDTDAPSQLSRTPSTACRKTRLMHHQHRAPCVLR